MCCAVVGSITIILLSAAASMICPATSHQPPASRGPARINRISQPAPDQKIRDKLKISTDRETVTPLHRPSNKFYTETHLWYQKNKVNIIFSLASGHHALCAAATLLICKHSATKEVLSNTHSKALSKSVDDNNPLTKIHLKFVNIQRLLFAVIN